MSASGVRTRLQIRRLVGAVTLLFVFLLPLHFHFLAIGQVTKECSCLHGTRTQLALAADLPHAAAPVELNVVASAFESLATHLWFGSQKVRGPPPSTSL